MLGDMASLYFKEEIAQVQSLFIFLLEFMHKNKNPSIFPIMYVKRNMNGERKMIYLILSYFIGFFIVSIIKRFHWSFENFMDYNTGGILSAATVILIVFFTGGIEAKYETDTEYYRIKEVSKDQYFIGNTETNEILVFLAGEASWKIFPEEKVKIQATKGQPIIQMEVNKVKEPTRAETVLFFITSEGMEKEIIQSATLYLPD